MADGAAPDPLTGMDGRRMRRVALVFFVLLAAVVLLATWVGRGVAVRMLQDRWPEFSEARAQEYLGTAVQRFTAVQRSIRTYATELAQDEEVQAFLAGGRKDTTHLFAEAERISDLYGAGVEIHGRDARLLAWGGLSGPVEARDVRRALEGQLVSSVSSTPIASQLFVVCPVRTPGGIAGAVVVRQTIGVTYPLSERFVGQKGLAARISDELGVPVEFAFDADALPNPDGRFVSGPLYGIDSTRLGVVSVMKPVRSGYLESVASTFDRAAGGAVLVLLLSAGWLGVGALLRSRWSRGAKGAAAAAVVWIVRALMLAAGVPSPTLVSGGVFDPAVYASTFGGGIARSAGEMTLTGIALGLSIVIPGALFLRRPPGGPAFRYPRNGLVRTLLLLAAAAALPVLLRGYAAVVRSAVFDATLAYNDPRIIAPSPELGVMVVNLILLSAAVVVVSALLASYVLVFFAGENTGTARRVGWASGAAALAAVAFLFGLLHPTPLTGHLYRAGFVAVLAAWTWTLDRRARRLQDLVTLKNFLLTLAIAAAFLFPVLEGFVAEKDRERMRIFAKDYLQPVDGWLATIVDEALDGFLQRGTGEFLRTAPPEEVERLAFSHWAGSTISKEGYNCLFLVTDAGGMPLSRFEIGGTTMLPPDLGGRISPDDDRNIQVTEIGSGQGSAKVYSGTLPLRAEGDTLVGFARVVVTAGQQALFRGEAPPILRGLPGGGVGTVFRPVVVSEFRNGRLLASSNPLWPMSLPVPDAVREAFADPAVNSVWHEEVVDGQTYETLYTRPSPQSPRVLGLGLQRPSLLSRLNTVLLFVIYCAAIALLVAVVVLAVRALRGRPYVFTFRDRLLAALMATAILPVVILAAYTRNEAAGRLLAASGERLERETAAIVLNLQQGGDDWRAGVLAAGVPELIAGELGADFNLYVGNLLAATSRPELYEAGILDRRLDGTAYVNVVQQGKRFYVQTETIGQYKYAVGYRPLTDASGRAAGVVSVPTLYRQDAIDREVAEQNALVFGVYVLAVFGILVIASTFANRFAAPIQRLTQATRRVAAGDLDVPLGDVRAEGEIGELVRSFGGMTGELKRSRESIRAFERQSAWSEMARQVAHEIKNPLTPMKLALQHMRELFRDDAPEFRQQFEKSVAMIIGRIDALSRIASEFSGYARMPQPVLAPVDLNAVLREAVQLFDREENVRFTCSFAGDLPPVHADREGLHRVFVNVLRNALQAMPDGGVVTAATTRAGKRAVVTVTDSGTGIAEDVRPRLFEPNFSTKTDGMGLGLAIVKRILDDLDGTIALESVPGNGTTVTITLPLP